MTEKNVVLIIDDAKINRASLNRILCDTYEVLEAESAEQALDILSREAGRIAAMVLDLIMPGMSGFDFMKIYQKSEKFRNIPVIIATAEGNVKTERECLELGAWDFISKPYDPNITQFRLKNVIDRSQLQISKELKYRAEYDMLTGIYNKVKFFQMTGELLERNPSEKFVYIRLDIEKFQLVNSFFGVAEGDRLLQAIAESLRIRAQGNDKITYGRIEADIFGICMPFSGQEELIEIVGTARERLNSYKMEFDIVPTFGFYVIEDRGLSVNDMDDRANLASKKCKGNYMQSYAFYTEDMSERIVREQKIVNRMKKALEGEEFILYLQPKYELQSNMISGAEVLVRWLTPDNGLVSPGEFIPIFERNGFIMKLDHYIWEKSCQLLSKWIKEGKKPYPISVNISRVSLYNPKLVEVITGLVEKYEIPPELLQLELTESAYTSNPKAIREMMEEFQRKGFIILMDDFGSGYSSLNVLKDIAVDVLKIDMVFLSDTDQEGRSENILASVVRMAKWLNTPVVAEGVERKEQAAFLRSIGCEYVQGFYFAKPMPVEDYEQLAFSQPFRHKEEAPEQCIETDSLWTSTSQMEILFSNMLQAVAVYEYDDAKESFDVIRVNNAYYDLFGYRDINEPQRDILSTVDTEGREVLLRTFRQLSGTKEMAECEFMRKAESGKYIWIHLKLKYISQIGDRHVMIGSLTDVTEQKKLDSELQKYRYALTSSQKMKTILVVDDLEVNRASLRSIFEEKYRVLEAENGKEALDVLKKEKYEVDVILLDLMMPVMDGTMFLEQKRNDVKIEGIPVIIITADDTTRRQVQTLELGADDYIVKPFIPEIAIRRVGNVLESRKRFGQNIQGHDIAAEKMQRDGLTGLYNRNAAGELIRNVLSSSQGQQAMLLVDINNIHEIADRFSHKIAEDVICVFADILKNCFHKSDILARYDRDEFVVFSVDTPSVEYLERHCKILLEETGRLGEDGIRLECSIGAALADRESRDVMELMENADRALFEAKQKGSNQFAVYQNQK